jgi:hypothetical protein
VVATAAKGLQHDESPDPVVDASAYEPAIGELDHPGRQHPRVTDPELPLGLGPVGGPDVDPQSLDLGDLLPVVLVHDVDRLLAHDAGDRATAPQQLHPLTDEHLRVPPADGIEADESLVVDVGDHDADLVDVTGQHHPRPPARIQGGVGVPGHVRADLVRERFRLPPPCPGRCGLEGGGARRVEQGLEKREGFRRHGEYSGGCGFGRRSSSRKRAPGTGL